VNKIQNIDVRFSATSNFGKVRGDLAALEAQAASLNAAFAKGAYAQAPAIVDQKAWKRGSDAVKMASRAYLQAASSSGLLTAKQIQATSESEKYTKALQKQKLTMGDMIRHRGIMREVYRDQLRYQRMTAQYWGTDTAGRAVTSITVPKNVPHDLDNMRRRVGMIGNMVSSASTQFINLGKNIQWAGRQLTVGFTYPVVLFGAAAGVAAYKAEQGFAKINKVYDVSEKSLISLSAREQELGDLRAQSLTMATRAAQKYGASLDSTLAVEQELAATGLKGTELLKTTEQVQRISALGDIDPAQTTKMVIALQTAFKLKGDEVTNTLNFMNAASNATSLSLQDIAEATPRAASGLAALGGTAKQMTILLVSMREAGVDAAEGANALKSATARILNPTILAKGTKIFKSFGESIDVAGLSKKAKGNFYDFIKLLGEAENKSGKLTKEQKATANAALFGTYQFNRLTAALTNMGDAYAGVKNQTKAALDLQAQTNEQLAKTAELSRKAMMENPAGKFRAAYAELKIELVEVGNTFLDIATRVAGAVTGILDAFNKMSDGKKKLLLLAVAAMAIAGPVIMLTGLFFNLFGQFTKGIGNMLRFIGISKLVTEEEQMATITAEAQNKALAAQTSATNTLSAELKVLAAAYREATVAAQGALATTQKPGTPTGFIGPSPKPISGTSYIPTQQERTMMGTISNQGSNGRFISEQVRLEQARNKLAYEYMAANNQVARDATKMQQRSAAINRQTSAIKGNMSGAAVAGGVMAASMGTMMLTSNKTANSIAKWALVATLIVPAAKGLAVWTGAVAKSAWSAAAANIASQRAMVGGSLATARAAGVLGTMRAGVSGFAAGIGRVLGPGGVVTLGVLAIGGAYAWAINKGHEAQRKQEEIYNKQQAIQKDITNSTIAWKKSLGGVAGEYARIRQQSLIMPQGGGSQSEQDKLINYYKTKQQGQKSSYVKELQGLSDGELTNTLNQKFVDLQVQGQMTAQQAAEHMRAIYIAMGNSAAQAEQQASSLLDVWGNVKDKTFNWSFFLANALRNFNSSTDAEMKGRGKTAAEAFVAGMASFQQTGNRDGAKEFVQQFTSGTETQLTKSFDAISAKWGDQWNSFLADQGVHTKEQFAAWLRTNTVDQLQGLDWSKRGKYNLPYTEIMMDLQGAMKAQDSLLDGLDSILHFGPEIKSVFDLPNFRDISAITGTYKEQLSVVKQINAQMYDPSFRNDKNAQALAAATVNAYNFAHGLKQGKDLAEAVYNFMNRVPSAAAGAAGALKGVAGAAKSIPTTINITVNKKQFIDAYKTGMSNTMDSMAQSATDAFDSRWDAAIKAQEDRNSRAEEGQKRRHQAALDRIQAKIDAEKKADDIRQRLFDAEKTRLQRLADLENKNIDFNTAVNEGRLDDAAKIQNDINATTASNQMDDEEKKAQALSDARVARLEKQSARLQKIQERQEAAAQRNHQRAIDNMQKERDYQKAMLDQRLELFKSYTARNQKDLERWMKVVGLSYDDFGKSVKARGKSWSEYFRTELSTQVRVAATQIANDKIWEGVSKTMTGSLLKGMGFPSLAAFNKFMTTGTLPKNFGAETHHTGGVVGSGGGSRGNIPNSYRGLHPSERMVRAQVGERIINSKSSGKYGAILDAINSDSIGKDGVMGGISPGAADTAFMGMPMGGIVAGAVAKMFMSGVGVRLSNAITKAMASTAGSFSARAGQYNGTPFSAEQMKNAAIIANVGNRLGMSTRDIEIGIMTAITESGLRNVNYGDRDSLGLFQQRPSQGWGTAEQVTNPEYAATKFFNSLRGVDRAGMAPWLAAQAVQRSAYSDGSNYAKWWKAAIAIFTKGLTRAKSGTGAFSVADMMTDGGFKAGSGGKHRPINAMVTSGLHDASTGYPAIDFAASTGHPVYAVSDGVVSRSYDIRGYEPRRAGYGKAQDGYKSYGRVVYLKTNSGPEVLYAHLSRRSVATGKRVTGGSVLGYSGDTGNSTGPHLHFGSRGASPYAWLRKGGTIRYDNTPVIAHKGETMLSASLTNKFKDNVASGGGDSYSITVDLRGAYIRDDVDIKKAVYAAVDEREAKKGRKRVVR
jgi:TP901 family phage tail tape measure protein